MINSPFQHQFLVFGEVATITRDARGDTMFRLARWAEAGEIDLRFARDAFGLCGLVHCPHLTLGDVLPLSEV